MSNGDLLTRNSRGLVISVKGLMPSMAAPGVLLFPYCPQGSPQLPLLYLLRKHFENFFKHLSAHSKVTKTTKRIIKIQTSPLRMDATHLLSPQFLKGLSNPSAVFSTLSSFTVFWIAWILAWMLSPQEGKLKQHSPLNSSQLCPWASSRKSMAAQFCRVAFWVISSSSRRSLSTADVKFACLPIQHSRCESSPHAFAAATHGRKIDMSICFWQDQSVIWLSQSSRRFSKSRLLRAEFFSLFCQSWSNVMFGAKIVSLPRVQEPP